MRFRQFAGSICLLLVLPGSIFGHPASSTGQQGSAVLLQALTAMVGTTSINDVTLMGTARRIAGSDDETGTAVLKALVTGQSRLDFTLPSGQSSEIRSIDSNGAPTGEWIGPDGVSHPTPLHNLLTSSSWFQPAFAFAEIVSSMNSTVSYVGLETKDGISVNHLTVTQPPLDASSDTTALTQHLSQIDVFLDATTYFPVALDYNIHPDNNALIDIPVEIQFSDFTAVTGVQVPFHVQKYLNNSLVLDIQLQSATLNTGLTASIFTIQ